MMLEPLVKTLRELETERGGAGRIIMLAAAGKPLTQSLARELAREETLTLVCGRYEGIDARLMDILPVEQVSVGEAVLNGGEAAAMMLVEAATRLIPGFMGKEESGDDESFSAGLLEYPHFTRPEVFEDVPVPDVLRSGDHGRIAKWRREQSLRTTLRVRPDMLDGAPLTSDDMEYLRETVEAAGRLRLGRNLHCALVHYPVFLGDRKTGATSLTNLDVHDIARCSRTYGLGSFTVVTPLKDQQTILETLVRHWTEGPGGVSNPDRAEAFSLVRMASDVQGAIDLVEARTGQRPVLLGTSARGQRRHDASGCTGSACGPSGPAPFRDRARDGPGDSGCLRRHTEAAAVDGCVQPSPGAWGRSPLPLIGCSATAVRASSRPRLCGTVQCSVLIPPRRRGERAQATARFGSHRQTKRHNFRVARQTGQRLL